MYFRKVLKLVHRHRSGRRVSRRPFLLLKNPIWNNCLWNVGQFPIIIIIIILILILALMQSSTILVYYSSGAHNMHHNTKLDQETLLMGVCLLESSPIFHWIYHETKLQIDFESIKITVISLVILFGLRMIIVVFVIYEEVKCTNLCWELLFRRYIRFTLSSWRGSYGNLSNATCSTGAFLRKAFYLWKVCRSAVEVACMEFK